jgi:hypothetical protein
VCSSDLAVAFGVFFKQSGAFFVIVGVRRKTQELKDNARTMDDSLELESLFSLEPKTGDDLIQSANAPSASALEFLEQIHRRNSEALKTIIHNNGWPAALLVSKDAEAAAFMIVQHADYDPVFQRACHLLLMESVICGDTQEIGFLAFLTDRILCNDGRRQRFGTQIREVTNGCFVPKPMEDPEDVDEIRLRAGLKETLSDYLQRINDGDLLLYRPLLNGYAEQLEHAKENKIIPFPVKGNSTPPA